MVFLPKTTIFEGHVGLHFHKGSLIEVLPPGQHRFVGVGHCFVAVDTRPASVVVGGQEVATSDGGTLRISIVLNYQIEDAALHYRSGQTDSPIGDSAADLFGQRRDREPRMQEMARIAVREWVVSRTFKDAFDQRATLVGEIQPALGTETKAVGIKLLSLSLLDMTVAGGLRGALFDQLKAQLEGETALIRARNESATMRNLLNTARLVREHPGLLELRVLSSGQKPRITFVVGGDSSRATTGVEQGTTDE